MYRVPDPHLKNSSSKAADGHNSNDTDSESSPVEEELNPKSEHSKPLPVNEGLNSKLTNEDDSLYLRPCIKQGTCYIEQN